MVQNSELLRGCVSPFQIFRDPVSRLVAQVDSATLLAEDLPFIKDRLHRRILLAIMPAPVKMPVTATHDSHYGTCLGHLGWHDTDRIISIYVMLPRQLGTVTCCCCCHLHYRTKLRQCKWSIKVHLHWQHLLAIMPAPAKMPATATRDSHYCTCLGHLGWGNTDRINSIRMFTLAKFVSETVSNSNT